MYISQIIKKVLIIQNLIGFMNEEYYLSFDTLTILDYPFRVIFKSFHKNGAKQ